MQKCCFPFPMEKYIFRAKLDSSIEPYVAFEMKMNTVLMFPPQTNIVEISFFREGKSLPLWTSFQ